MKKRIGRQLLAGLLAFGMVLTMPYVTLNEAWADESGIAINVTNFPDDSFRKYVKSNFDKDSNGELSQSEIAGVTDIHIGESEVSSLKGVEYFTALEYLFCDNNQLTNLDLSKNTSLTDLDCNNNQLTNLDVSKNVLMFRLLCGDNELTNLDLSKNTELITLQCDNNHIAYLDLSKNTNIKEAVEAYGTTIYTFVFLLKSKYAI